MHNTLHVTRAATHAHPDTRTRTYTHTQVSGLNCVILVQRFTVRWVLSAIFPIMATTWLGFLVRALACAEWRARSRVRAAAAACACDGARVCAHTTCHVVWCRLTALPDTHTHTHAANAGVLPASRRHERAAR
jgi:hypothetical protein